MSPVSAFADDVKIAEIASKTLIRDTLRNDLVQIQKEKSRCDREKKNWKIATIAGAVGVATTATIGVVQYNKQQDLKTQITQ
ncbi:MAG: hypothetical protein FWG39_03450 [Alphaproteobacteria bacterium]|nr:hypothetical protein [Alphaproteobacteria bacterium]